MNKTDFFNDLSNQISEPLYLTDKTDEVNEEVKFNYWQLGIPDDVLAETTVADLLEFIQLVKSNYRIQLNKSDFNIDLIFYLWVDEMVGQICFNFINSNHERLPFGCQLKFTDNAEDIIAKYFKSNYRNGIPIDELETVETSEELSEEDILENELHDNFVLTVFQETIKKQR